MLQRMNPPDERLVSGTAYLGALRFVLATAVVMFHIWTPVAPDAGRHAVAGFFLISGFLITKITRESYLNRPVAFMANRALRIYPQYLIACLITILMGWLFASISSGPYLVSIVPKTLAQWIGQATIGISGEYVPLLPPVWSLSVELYFYFFIGLLTHDSLRLTVICFSVSIAVAALCLFKYLAYPFYFSAQSDAFVFFAGSLAYFISKRYTMPLFLLVPALVSYAVAMFALPHFMKIEDYSGPVPHLFLLISVACSFVIVVIMQQGMVKTSALTRLSSRLGKLSYPIFLLHWPVAMPFAYMFDSDRTFVFLSSYPALLLVSVVMVAFVDAPIEKLRTSIRGRGRSVAMAAKG